MKTLITMVAVIAVSLSSCSKNEVLPNQSEDNAILFSTYTGISVKGAEMDADQLQTDGFGVLAYDHGVAGSFSNTSTPNFMYNTHVTSDSSASSGWTYSPIKYWSNDDNNYYSFFAYAPYGTTTNGITPDAASTQSGAPKIKHTINYSTPTSMVDFVAGQEINRVGGGYY